MNNVKLTVALVGADGAGKTTIARRVEQGPPLRAKYIYMGINPDAASHALPTTRLLHAVKRRLGYASSQGGPPDPSKRPATRGGGPLRRIARAVKGNLRLVNQLAEEWFRQGVAWWYRPGTRWPHTTKPKPALRPASATEPTFLTPCRLFTIANPGLPGRCARGSLS